MSNASRQIKSKNEYFPNWVLGRSLCMQILAGTSLPLLPFLARKSESIFTVNDIIITKLLDCVCAVGWHACIACDTWVYRPSYYFVVESIVSILLLSIIQNRIEQIYGWYQFVIWGSIQWPQSILFVRVMHTYHFLLFFLFVFFFSHTNPTAHTTISLWIFCCLSPMFARWPKTVGNLFLSFSIIANGFG